MKNLLALIGAVVVLVVVGGWYLGWYKLATESGGDGNRKINVDVNTKKIADDLKKGREKVGDLIEQSTSDKKVEGQPTSWTLPPLPSLPSAPNTTPIELNPDGSLKTTITIPPPPLFKGNK